MSTATAPTMYTLREAAAELGISRATLQQYIGKGYATAVRTELTDGAGRVTGWQWRITADELARLKARPRRASS